MLTSYQDPRACDARGPMRNNESALNGSEFNLLLRVQILPIGFHRCDEDRNQKQSTSQSDYQRRVCLDRHVVLLLFSAFETQFSHGYTNTADV